MNGEALKKTAAKIKQSQRIVITSHLRPDGDSLCTSIALYHLGRKLGKEMVIINKDPTPHPFDSFPSINLIQIGEIPPDKFDCVILLECANVSRSGHSTLDNYFKINIDHHHSNDYYGDINWVEPEASAIAEMVYYLCRELEVKITPEIADHLYCGIVSDTGSFQFSNTRAEAFEVCAHLIKSGADPIKISELLFNNNTPDKIILLGRVLSRLQIKGQGKIAVISMFKQELASLGLKEIDTEDITTLARSIRNIQVVLFFKEMEQDVYRVSIRSRGRANAAAIAEHFGGGGHFHAAGFTVQGKYEALIEEIPEKVYFLFLKGL
jgi:phosphoesterase RecJ-like protein